MQETRKMLCRARDLRNPRNKFDLKNNWWLNSMTKYANPLQVSRNRKNFLSCHSQRVALKGVLQSTLPVQAGVPQGSVLGPVLFWFSSMISDSLENALYFFADDSTLCRTICHPSNWQSAASSLSADLGKITSWSGPQQYR